LVNQAQTHIRKLSVQCIPASNREQTGQSVSELEELEKEMQSRVVGNFNEIAGPLWKEWCAWDEEYVLERFVDCGFKYRGYHQPWNPSLADWRYRKVLEDLETQACQHGMKSWTHLMRNAHEEELRTLFQRFKNYLTTHQQGSRCYTAPVDLPRSWAMVQHGSYYPPTWRSYLDSRTGRQYQKLPLDFDTADRAFEMELKRWTQQLYLQEQRRRTRIAKSTGQLSHMPAIGHTSPTSLSPTAKSFSPTPLESQHQVPAGLELPLSANLTSFSQYYSLQSGEMLSRAERSIPQRTPAEYRPSAIRFPPHSLSMETRLRTSLTRHLLPFDLFDDEFQQGSGNEHRPGHPTFR